MTTRDDCKTCFCDAKRQHRAFVHISDDYANRFQKEQEEYIDGKRRRTQPHKCLLTVSEVPKPDVEYSCRPDSVCGQAAVAPRTNTKIKPFMILKPILAVCILVLTMVLIYPPALPSVYPSYTVLQVYKGEARSRHTNWTSPEVHAIVTKLSYWCISIVWCFCIS